MRRRSLRIRDELAAAAGDQFAILREVGRGGMGWVFLARDLQLNRRVALKVLSPGLLMEDGMGERFLREAQILASLRHAHIVGVHSVHQVGDLHFFAMDFIDGPGLDRVLRARAPLDFRPIRTIAYMVGSALDYGHHRGRGVIHRDIKPANVILDSEGSVVVTDFGISKVLAGNTRLTRTGIVVGTPEFMSPEQCGGQEVTAASDQYSLGVLLYQMITGTPPFTGSTVEVLLGHVQGTPSAILERRPDCPVPMAEAVERMLAKTPEERFSDIAAALDAVGATPVGLRSPERGELTDLARETMASTASIDISSPLSPARGLGAPGGEAGPHEDEDGEGSRRHTPPTGLTISDLHIGSPRSRLEPGDSIPIWVHAQDDGGFAVPDAPIRLTVDNPEIASLDEGGLLVARRSGVVTVTATTGEIERQVTLEIVEPRRPARVLVEPPQIDLVVGERLDLVARVLDTDGEEMAVPVEWTLGDDQVFTLDGAVLHAERPGRDIVTATAGLVSTSIQAQARGVPVAVVLDGARTECSPGDSFRVTPLVVDRDGVPIPGLPVRWRSSDPSIVRVDDDGTVRPRKAGTASIRVVHGELDTGFDLRVVDAPAPGGVVAAGGPVVEAGGSSGGGDASEPVPAATGAAKTAPPPVPGARPKRPVPVALVVGSVAVVAAVGLFALTRSPDGSTGADPVTEGVGAGIDVGADLGSGVGPEPGAPTSGVPAATTDSVRAAPTPPPAGQVAQESPPRDETEVPGRREVAAPGPAASDPPPSDRGAADPPASRGASTAAADPPADPEPAPADPEVRPAEPAATRAPVEATPSPAAGPPATVRIQVRPEAITSVDGAPRPDSLRGTNVFELAPGEYRLQLSRPGFVPFDTLVVLEPGQDLVIRKRLVPAGDR